MSRTAPTRGRQIAAGLAVAGLVVAMTWLSFARTGVELNFGSLWEYRQRLWNGFVMTVIIAIGALALSLVLGLVTVMARRSGVLFFEYAARTYVQIIRGTPLLLQIWLLYYGLGSLFPQIPWIRSSELWPYLRQAWPYAVMALTLSYAGYEGGVMRGAFAGVNKGQLETADAFGMPRLTKFRRIWLPQAIRNVLPTLGGETILQLKATPLVATITVVEIYSVSSRVRSDTLIVYEPLLLLAVFYMMIAGIITLIFRRFEQQVPGRTNRG